MAVRLFLLQRSPQKGMERLGGHILLSARVSMKVFYDFITVVYLELKKEVNVCVLSLGILPI